MSAHPGHQGAARTWASPVDSPAWHGLAGQADRTHSGGHGSDIDQSCRTGQPANGGTRRPSPAPGGPMSRSSPMDS